MNSPIEQSELMRVGVTRTEVETVVSALAAAVSREDWTFGQQLDAEVLKERLRVLLEVHREASEFAVIPPWFCL